MRNYNRMMLGVWSLVAVIYVWVRLRGGPDTIPLLCGAIAVACTFLLYPKGTKYGFQEVSENEVRSSLGFCVRIDGAELVYKEGSNTLTIGPQSPSSGVSKFLVNDATIERWDPPNDQIRLTNKQKSEIQSRIVQALTYRQVKSGRR